jgi:flagellar hook-associated protein 2
MAGLTSQGIGSGLDIQGLVTKLVAAEKQPRQDQITRAQTSTVTTISALATLKGALSSFSDSLNGLDSVDAFDTRSTTSSASDVFTATATNAAIAGSYDVQVSQLASAHQIATKAFPQGSTQNVGTGTLTIAVGTSNFSVSIDSNHQTLAQIRDAINQATGNDDFVRATIVNASDGAHLVLSAQAAGDANKIVVSQADGNGGLASLAYNPSLLTHYDEKHPAQDAVIYVAGYEHRSTSNTFADAIDGVSITALKEDDADTTHTLTVADDTGGTAARIKSFVTQYNALETQIAKLRSYDPQTKAAGPLLGDAMMRGMENTLRSQLTAAVGGLTGNYQSLASIGITTQKDGTLSLNSDKLSAALASDYTGVAKLFGSDGGVATKLSASLDAMLATDAPIVKRVDSLNSKSVELQQEQTDLDARMQTITDRYNAQFNALDSLLANLQSTSSFLSQQLDSIAKIGSSSSSKK